MEPDINNRGMEKIMNNFYKRILESKYPYIVAEIGSNHNGDMNLAKKMIKSAKECGADCVKFQSFSNKSLISEEEYNRNQKYYDSPKKHFGSLREMVEKYYLREEQHNELKKYCNEINIEFASSPFSNEEVDLLNNLDVPFYKVASMDINNLPLLEYIAKKQKPVVLSTGMATISEIENAIETVEKQNNYEIVILHCISIYPPEYKDIHLKNIQMLKSTFEYPVGFSDHSIGTAIPLAAITLGSVFLEKHFTTDKDLPGWDHEISSNPEELSTIVNESKNIIDALGNFKRTVSTAEYEKRNKFRRSLLVNKPMKKGEILNTEDLFAKRPGTGISPDEIKYVLGRKLIKDYETDELLKWEDLS